MLLKRKKSINKKKHQDECEFCGELKQFSLDSTVCDDCDRELKNEQEVASVEKEKVWASKHNCRGCEEPLSMDRYFMCHDCLSPYEMESEDRVFDSFDDMAA